MQRGLIIFLIAWVAGCASGPPPQTLRFHEQVTGNLPASFARPVIIPSTGQQLVIDPEPTLTEHDVFAARLEPTAGGAGVLLKFDVHGANLLAEMSTRLRGQSVVVFVNDRPIGTVLVEHPIATGELLLTGDMTDEQVHLLVDSLNKAANRHRDLGDSKLEP